MAAALPTVADKPRYVAAMFGRIAARYDLMNTIMTAGQDAAWRRVVAETALNTRPAAPLSNVGTGADQVTGGTVPAEPAAARFPDVGTGADRVTGGTVPAEPAAARFPDVSTGTARVAQGTVAADPAARVLDVGTGTGKLAQVILDTHPGARVVGVDFTFGMLRVAPRWLRLAAADALRLPFSDCAFDAIVSAFVVRNLADVPQGVTEQVRVLRQGGRLVVLETTPGPPGLLRPLYRLFFRHIVPLLGRLIVGDGSAYTYLPESTLAFLEPGRLADLLRQHGLVDVTIRQLALGCVAVISGRKPIMLAATGGTI